MFNERLKLLRENYKLSQTEFGDHIGVTNQTVSNWENNNIAPSVEMVIKIAKYFNVSTDYLLDLDNQMSVKVDGISIEHMVHIQSLINDIRDLNVKVEKQKKKD